MAKGLLCCSKYFLDSISNSQFPLLRPSLKSNELVPAQDNRRKFTQCYFLDLLQAVVTGK